MASKKEQLAANEAEKRLLKNQLKGEPGCIIEIRAILKEPGVRVDFLDETGMTPLQHAAFRGKTELCELFLSQGADVNTDYHDNGYSTLMFAALSGSAEVTRLILEAGANVYCLNSVNRTASQMAAFVGQHQCVSLINNFYPLRDMEYYAKPQGLETEPKLPPELAPTLCKIVNMSNFHPVKMCYCLRDYPGMLDNAKKVAKVLDAICEKSMKSRETNDVLAVKTHYYACIIRHTAKIITESNISIEAWIKSLIRGNDVDGFPELQEKLIRQSLKEFPYPESQLLQSIVRNIAPVKVGEHPTALSMLVSGINGQQFLSNDESSCETCGERKAEKKCSACKAVNYCHQQCQKYHWTTHKKFCKQLGEEFIKREEEKARQEAVDAEQKRIQDEATEKKRSEEKLKADAATDDTEVMGAENSQDGGKKEDQPDAIGEENSQDGGKEEHQPEVIAEENSKDGGKEEDQPEVIAEENSKDGGKEEDQPEVIGEQGEINEDDVELKFKTLKSTNTSPESETQENGCGDAKN